MRVIIVGLCISADLLSFFYLGATANPSPPFHSLLRFSLFTIKFHAARCPSQPILGALGFGSGQKGIRVFAENHLCMHTLYNFCRCTGCSLEAGAYGLCAVVKKFSVTWQNSLFSLKPTYRSIAKVECLNYVLFDCNIRSHFTRATACRPIGGYRCLKH